MKLFLALLFLAASAVGKLTAPEISNRYTAYTGATNALNFAWSSGDVEYGELVGVFASGNNCDKSATETAGVYPHVEIMPSKELSNTNNKLLQAQSPQVTSAFGSLPTTSGISAYQLCYCNRDPSTAKCNYEQKVGELNVIDLVPRHFAATGVASSTFYMSLTAGPTLKFQATTTADRVLAIADGYASMCGAATESTEWSSSKTKLTANSATPMISGPTAAATLGPRRLRFWPAKLWQPTDL
jgi:hypothetical protein